jgi:hypothetical protein
MNAKRRTARVRWAGLLLAATLIGLAGQSPSALAQTRVVRGTTQTSVNPNAQVSPSANANQNVNASQDVNANQDVNASQDVNANQDVNVHRDIDVDVDRDYHPIATAAAVGTVPVATAAVVGSVVHSLPSACTAVQLGDITYQQCGSTWYQPQYSGTQLTYLVVNPPR